MKEKIIDYLEKELSPQDRMAFEQALKSDAELQKAFIFQKAQWEKLAMLRFNAKAAALLKSYETVEEEEVASDVPENAVIKPMPFAFMTVRRVRFAAVAAAVLLFLFNYNSLINWIKPSIPTAQNTPIVAEKPVESTPAVIPAPVVTPNPTATVTIPTQQKLKPSPAIPQKEPLSNPLTTPAEIVEVVKEQPLIAGSDKPNGSIFLTQDATAPKMPIDTNVFVLDNAYDFKGDNELISKHLSEISCNNYTVSFLIKRDGTVENPKFEKGDKNCEIALLNQIKTMPRLKKPFYDGKAVDYRYFFTKN